MDVNDKDLRVTVVAFLYWPFGLSVWNSPLLRPFQFWLHFFYNGFSVTVAVAYSVGPVVLGCAVAVILAMHQVGSIRKMLGIALLATLVPLIYPPVVVCLSGFIWLAISIMGIVFVYLGPVAVLGGLTQTLVLGTVEFCANQQKLKEQLQCVNSQRDLSILQVVTALVVAPLSLFTTGAMIIVLALPRAPMIVINLYRLTVVRMWQCWKRNMNAITFMTAEFSVTRIILLLAHLGALLLWCLSVVLGLPVIALGVLFGMLLLVLLAALWPAYVASVAVNRQANKVRTGSPPQSEIQIPTATCLDACRPKAVGDGAVYGSVATDDDIDEDELIAPLVFEENPTRQRKCGKQKKAPAFTVLATTKRIIRSLPLLLGRFGSSVDIALVASYQLLFVCNVICQAGMKCWWDPSMSLRAMLELWQFVTGDGGRLQWSRRMANDMSNMAQPSVMGLVKTRQCCCWNGWNWQPDWKILVKEHGFVGTEWESAWNGFWYQMNLAKEEAMMRNWWTPAFLVACPTSVMTGLLAVVMLQCCLRSDYEQMPLTELLLTTQTGETIGTLRLTESNRPKNVDIVDQIWACLVEARKGCHEYISNNDNSNNSLDHLVSVLCAYTEGSGKEDDLVAWNGVSVKKLDPMEPLHKLFACLLAADEAVEDLPLLFQTFLKKSNCVNALDQMVNAELMFVSPLQKSDEGLNGQPRRRIDALRNVHKNIRHASRLIANQFSFQMALIHHLVEPLDDL